MKHFYTLLFSSLLVFSTSNVLAQIAPCTFTGGSVYIDHTTVPWMMNATVNGMSMYNYSWTDTNGLVISTANQTPFYTQWCVTIVDNITGCDTTICQDCTADSTALCMCTMIYMPVCGCDGFQYSNSCLADCADVSWTPAIPSGQLGGWLPCTQPSTCEVEIIGDSNMCNLGSPQVLTAIPTGNGTSPYTYLWGNGQSNSPNLTIITPGTYCVTVTDANGCVDSACFTVDIEDIVIYSTPSPSIICLGDTIALEFWNTPLTNIVWMPTGDTIHMIHDNPNISTTYIVEGIDVNGCDRRGEILVTVDSCTAIPPSWDCVGNACVDPGTGAGMYVSQASCDNVCIVNGVEEQTTNKKLLKITDLLGRETKGFKNDVLFYIYDDGTVEKRIVIE